MLTKDDLMKSTISLIQVCQDNQSLYASVGIPLSHLSDTSKELTRYSLCVDTRVYGYAKGIHLYLNEGVDLHILYGTRVDLRGIPPQSEEGRKRLEVFVLCILSVLAEEGFSVEPPREIEITEPPPPLASNATNPGHYKQGGLECIDVIRAFQLDFLTGNVVKYVLRHQNKNGLEDLEKARVYLDWAISNLKEGGK